MHNSRSPCHTPALAVSSIQTETQSNPCPPHARKSVGSLDKKRARDRRAQQNLRIKRLGRIQELEQQVATLDNEARRYRCICDGLSRENKLLHARQNAVRRMVTSWGPEDYPIREASSSAEVFLGNGAVQMAVSVLLPAAVVSETQSAAQDIMEFSRASPVGTPSPQLDCPTDPAISHWTLTPFHEDGDAIMTDCFRLWLQRPSLVESSPESPAPLELLYGSKTNFLANVIHEAVRKWPCRDPERLAGGWLCYHYIKWMVRPTEAAYSHLQPWQLPVKEQLQKPHPYFIDLLWWPGLRANMINMQHRYDLADAFALFTCCVKVRWPWGKNFLEPGDDGEFRILPEFYDTFTTIDGWGLTDELMLRYPAIVDGLDIESVRFQFP